MAGISERRLRDIDGGYAWLVLLMSYLGTSINSCILFMGGVLYTALLEKYKQGAAKTSLVGSLSFGILCFCAPIASAFLNKFSCRVSIVTGGILTTTGFALSAFVPSLDWTIVTAGAITGIGFAFSSAGLICVVGFYFQKWRENVLTITFILVGVIMFSSSPLALYLLDQYGLSGTFLILAGMQAQVCIVGLVCKSSIIEHEVKTQRKIVRKENTSNRFSEYFDISLVKNFAFSSFLISTSAWNFAMNIALIHLPNYVTVLGGSGNDINLLMTALSISNLTGRVLGLIVVSKMKTKSLTVDVISLLIPGVITTAFPFYSNFSYAKYIFAIQLGLFLGIPSSMMTALSVRFVGLSKLSEAYALSYMFSGFGVSTGPFIAGYVYGATRSYENSYLIAGIVLLIGSAFGLASMCLERLKKGNNNVKELDLDMNGTQTDKHNTNEQTVSIDTGLLQMTNKSVSRISL